MAFKEMGKNDSGDKAFAKLTELAAGETLTGYLLGFIDSKSIEGAVNLIMEIDGVSTYVATAGNVKWAAKDRKLVIGQNTRFTRQEDTKVKGMKSTSFLIEQDADDTIPVAASTAPPVQAARPAPQNNSVADKIKAMKEGKGAATTR